MAAMIYEAYSLLGTYHKDITVVTALNNPSAKQVCVHGVHGAGKSYLCDLLSKSMGIPVVDENYEAIKAIVQSGKNITVDMIRMLSQREVPESCIIDRTGVDVIVYEMAKLMHVDGFNLQMACAIVEAKYPYVNRDYVASNHIWIILDNIDLGINRVKERNREWDDSIERGYYRTLNDCANCIATRWNGSSTTKGR